jgi:general secretion pathway protein F
MRFEMKAVRAQGAVVALTLEALDERDAKAQADAQGYSVLTVRPLRTWARAVGPRAGQFPLMLFTQELLSLMSAGLSIVESLGTLAQKEARPEARKIVQRIVSQLHEGRSLSHALQTFPAVFPVLYVSTVRASEKTGDLAEALKRYVAYQAQVDFVRKKVVSASIYPVLLMGAGGLVTLFLMGYVVPRFSRIYEDIGTSLPYLSRVLLQWGKFLEANGAIALAVLTTAVAALAWLFARAGTRNAILGGLWRLPGIGERMRVYQLARFYRTLGMLLRGGMAIGPALAMVRDLLQTDLRARLRGAEKVITEGRSISYAMEAHGLTTPVSLRMLQVGERTGEMGDMMERIAAFHDEEMARWVDWFTRLFEPLLMTIIGLVIGAVVVLMYLPIFELAGTLQ